MNTSATRELAIIAPTESAAVSLGVLQASSPASLVAGASEMAAALAGVIRSQHLSTRIQGRDYVQVEGWTTLATMLGVTAREVATTEQDGIYTATVELVRMADGAVISRASAECGSPDELDKYRKPVWANRPRYARRSMAQTRATGKACRLAFSWVMRLAGYEPTPAEEMPSEQPIAAPVPPLAPTGAPQPGRPSAAPLEGGATITDQQHRLLEARIKETGLDRERVKAWIARAWGCQHLSAVPAAHFPGLLKRLEVWAQAEREAWLDGLASGTGG